MGYDIQIEDEGNPVFWGEGILPFDRLNLYKKIPLSSDWYS